MNDYKTFRVTIIDDEASVIKCEYPLVSNVVMYKVCRRYQTIRPNHTAQHPGCLYNTKNR